MANRATIKNSKNGVDIVDSGDSTIYLMTDVPKKKFNWYDPAIKLVTAPGQPHTSLDSCKLDLPGLPKDLPTPGHVMPGFHHNLLGIGEFCDADCKLLFTNTSVTIFDKKGEPLITGWKDNNCTKLWNISLLPNEDDSPVHNQTEQTMLGV